MTIVFILFLVSTNFTKGNLYPLAVLVLGKWHTAIYQNFFGKTSCSL